jgi:hypothetical protein
VEPRKLTVPVTAGFLFWRKIAPRGDAMLT